MANARAKASKAKRAAPASVGEVLRSAREDLGITQVTLSEAISMPQNVISRIEAGKRESPRFETVARMAEGLDVSLDDIAAACGFTQKRSERSVSRTPALLAEARSLRRELVAILNRVDSLIETATSTGERRSKS